MVKRQVIIIGAGPAGITAAIQLSRGGLRPLLLEKSHIGGLIKSANLVENYPGFPKGISGVKMAELLKRHLKVHRVDIDFEEAISVDFKDDAFIIKTNNEDYNSDYLIIAPGTKPKEFSVAGWDETYGKCAFKEIYPLLDKQGKHIAIIGGGDAAFDYALNLAKKNQVTINYRADKNSCLPLLQQRAEVNPRILCRANIVLQRIVSLNDCMELHWQTGKLAFSEKVDYLLTAVGRIPNLDFLGENLKNLSSELERQNRLHVIGDAKNGNFRQMSIAAGEGMKAAMKILNKIVSLSSLKYNLTDVRVRDAPDY